MTNVNLADGTTAPVVSVTVPVMLPPAAAQIFKLVKTMIVKRKRLRFALEAAKDKIESSRVHLNSW